MIPWRLLFVLLLPTVAAFRPPATTQTCPARIENRKLGPLFAAGPKEVTAIATDAVASTSSSWKELANKLTSTKPMEDPKDVQQVFSALTDTLDSMLHQTVDKMETLLNQFNEAFVTLLTSLANNGSGDASAGSLINLNLDPILAQIRETASAIGVSNEDIGKIIGLINGVTGALNTPETIAATTLISYVIINSILTWGDSPPPGRPYPKGKYDPIGARVYFDQRPLQVVARSLTIATKSLAFALRLAGDKLKGEETWVKKQEDRGFELAQLLTELGPTFIKSTY
jgi:hypothetical protein